MNWASDKPGGEIDAGHYLSIGSAPHMRFIEGNVHAQRKSCNKPGGAKKLLLRVVERAVKEKLKIYKAAAQADGVNFLPFVISSYGIMNPGATATLKNLSEHWALYNEDTASIRYRQSVRMLQVSVVQQFAQSRLNLIQDQRRVRHLDARAREGL